MKNNFSDIFDKIHNVASISKDIIYIAYWVNAMKT